MYNGSEISLLVILVFTMEQKLSLIILLITL